MKHELDKMMSLIKDYKTGYGGVTDSFMRKELEFFAKDYHTEKCNIADVVGQSEQLSQCKCGNTVQIECDDCKDDRIRSEYI